MLNAVAVNVVAQAERSGPLGPEFGKASPVGLLVAVSGGIGFVGLVIPHLCRMVVGSLHRRLLPLAASVGGLFLLWVDVISRVIVAPTEMPLGVVTGLIGAPVFLIVMGRRNYGFGGGS